MNKINTSLYEDKHPKTSMKGLGFANKDAQKINKNLLDFYLFLSLEPDF